MHKYRLVFDSEKFVYYIQKSIVGNTITTMNGPAVVMNWETVKDDEGKRREFLTETIALRNVILLNDRTMANKMQKDSVKDIVILEIE